MRALIANSYAKQSVGTQTTNIERGHGQGSESEAGVVNKSGWLETSVEIER